MHFILIDRRSKNSKLIRKQSTNICIGSTSVCDVMCLTLVRVYYDDVCSVCSSELSQRCLWTTHWPPSPAVCLADAPAQPVSKHASSDWSSRLSNLATMLALVIRMGGAQTCTSTYCINVNIMRHSFQFDTFVVTIPGILSSGVNTV